jgi:primary-amine oxidase
MAAQRRWKVVNTQHTNALGAAPGYLFMPGANSRPYAQENGFLRTRAGFVNAHVWVTPYHPDEEYAAGAYLNQTAPNRGLTQWTQANRSIENQDIVVWYSLGITHVPRPEEWPLMPVHRAGFKLVPIGFFEHNPAMVLLLADYIRSEKRFQFGSSLRHAPVRNIHGFR